MPWDTEPYKNLFDKKELKFPSRGRVGKDDEENFHDKMNDLYDRESSYARKLDSVHEEMRELGLQFCPKKYKYFIRFIFRVESIDKNAKGVYEQTFYSEMKPKNVKRFCKQYLKEKRCVSSRWLNIFIQSIKIKKRPLRAEGVVVRKGSPKTKKNPPSKKSASKQKKILGLIPVHIKKHRDKNDGHHHIIFGDLGNKHVSVGLTTKTTKGKNSSHKNYKCEVDPLGEGKTSYLRRQGTVAPKKEYIEPGRKGAMSPKDYEQAKVYAERAKQKYLNKKK